MERKKVLADKNQIDAFCGNGGKAGLKNHLPPDIIESFKLNLCY